MKNPAYKQLMRDTIGNVFVSTIRLPSHPGEPLRYETAVFSPPDNTGDPKAMISSGTYAEALAEHGRIVTGLERGEIQYNPRNPAVFLVAGLQLEQPLVVIMLALAGLGILKLTSRG